MSDKPDWVEPEEKHHGHPRFYKIIDELRDLHDRKNHDYAAGGNPLGNFLRVSEILSLYPGLRLDDPTVVALTYAMKQIDAVLWILSNGHGSVVEGTQDRLQDVSVYSIIAMILEGEK